TVSAITCSACAAFSARYISSLLWRRLPAAFGLDLNHTLKAVDSDGAGHRMAWHHMPGLEYQTHDFQARGANQRLRAKLCLWLCAERSNGLAGLCMRGCHVSRPGGGLFQASKGGRRCPKAGFGLLVS